MKRTELRKELIEANHHIGETVSELWKGGTLKKCVPAHIILENSFDELAAEYSGQGISDRHAALLLAQDVHEFNIDSIAKPLGWRGINGNLGKLVKMNMLRLMKPDWIKKLAEETGYNDRNPLGLGDEDDKLERAYLGHEFDESELDDEDLIDMGAYAVEDESDNQAEIEREREERYFDEFFTSDAHEAKIHDLIKSIQDDIADADDDDNSNHITEIECTEEQRENLKKTAGLITQLRVQPGALKHFSKNPEDLLTVKKMLSEGRKTAVVSFMNGMGLIKEQTNDMAVTLKKRAGLI